MREQTVWRREDRLVHPRRNLRPGVRRFHRLPAQTALQCEIRRGIGHDIRSTGRLNQQRQIAGRYIHIDTIRNVTLCCYNCNLVESQQDKRREAKQGMLEVANILVCRFRENRSYPACTQVPYLVVGILYTTTGRCGRIDAVASLT